MRGSNSLLKRKLCRLFHLSFTFVGVFLLVIPLSTRAVYSSQVTLAWYSNTEKDLAGYNIYYGTSSGNYDASVDVGNWTSCTIAELEEGQTYYFAVTAYDFDGNESDFSSEVTWANDAEVVVQSGENYQVMPYGLQVGSRAYIDRTYYFTDVPGYLAGQTYIKTANDDKASTGSNFLSFDVNQGVTVYVAHDDYIKDKPAWLASFTDTGDQLVTTDLNKSLSLYAKDFPAGTVTLGGNEGPGDSMYSVVVAPLR